MRDTWIVEQTSFTQEDTEKYESLFSLGNGNLGLRGNMEEQKSVCTAGTYINGFYETVPIHYGESAFGFPSEDQVLLDLPEGKMFRMYADGELFETDRAVRHSRILNMKEGILERTFSWETASGVGINVSFTRMVSFSLPSAAVQILRFSINKSLSSLEVVSSLVDPSGKESGGGIYDPRTASSMGIGALVKMKTSRSHAKVVSGYSTLRSGLFLAAGMDHEYAVEKCSEMTALSDGTGDSLLFHFSDISGELILVKYLSYRQSRKEKLQECFSLCSDDLSFCMTKGADYFRKQQAAYLDDFWSRSDILLKENKELQRAVRLNLFHLLQSAGKTGRTSIAAKGLSGRGYNGHYFWDSEVYIIPFFIHTLPDIARSLLMYRYSTLGDARARAKELSHAGALFPWRTINGKEASAYFPAGTAQYHINADIVHTMNMYLAVTEDYTFLVDAGFEIFVETARFWVDLGNYIPGKQGAFCIHEVTGPDEYTALVNNNYYTNIMAKDNLETAVRWYDWLQFHDSQSFSSLVTKLLVRREERLSWEQAAQRMYLPYNEEYGIFPQDDAFLDRPVWDLEATPRNKFPLLLHFHPLTIYRFQVLKQADVVMALFLKNESFSFADKKRTFDYYERITTGDSSLSAAVQGILALELGYVEKGYEYFLQTIYMDYHNVNGNVKDGIHTASMGGAWMMITYGFAGMREVNGSLYFTPHLPEEVKKLSFRIMFKKRQLEVTLTRRYLVFSLLKGRRISIVVNGIRVLLVPGEKKEILYNET